MSAPGEAFKISTISRAKRSAAMPCWASYSVAYGVPIGQTNCFFASCHLRIWLRNVAGTKRVNRRGVRTRCACGTLTASCAGTEGALRVGAPALAVGSALAMERRAVGHPCSGARCGVSVPARLLSIRSLSKVKPAFVRENTHTKTGKMVTPNSIIPRPHL